MDIRLDDLRGPKIAELLNIHLDFARAVSPPGSVHALDLEALRAPHISFWTAWDGERLLGCGALKELDSTHGEIKSMHTAKAARGRGVAAALLTRVIGEARLRGYQRLSLETGVTEDFAPARKLYQRFGFDTCAPFADYFADPFSVCMTRALAD